MERALERLYRAHEVPVWSMTTAEEREALVTGDVGALYRMGVHTFFLNHLARYELFGVNRDNYFERIREGMAYDPRFELGNMPVQRFVKT